MNAIVCACHVLEEEINFVLKENDLDFPVVFLDAGLHKKPDNLKNEIQKTINTMNGVDFILLGYGLCGNGTLGLTSQTATIVLPQYHDCIAMLLGSDKRYRANLGSENCSFFLTKGWLNFFNPKVKFYEDAVPRLGQERALRAAKLVFKPYQRFTLIETEEFEQDSPFKETEDLGTLFDLETHRMDGTLDILRKMVRGEWDKYFQVVPPGSKVKLWNL